MTLSTTYRVTVRSILVRVGLFALSITLYGLSSGAAYGQQAGSARLKDMVLLEGAAPIQITGYGLVVGLDRTGDRARGRRGAPYTVQSVANMLRRFGINVDPERLSTRNAAAVMVNATLTAFTGPGSTVDVTVSALGDARSLSGGVLLQTPLLNPVTEEVYAMAQGPVATGSVQASGLGASVQVNHSNTGRIPNGAVVTASQEMELANAAEVGLVLRRPDFTNAQRIAEAITADLAPATVQHAGLIRVDVSAANGGANGFLAAMENVSIEVDVPARVVINERTGTIVAGGTIRINEVMVTYGGIVISTQEDPFVSQPPPLSGGETVAGAVGSASINEETAQSVVLPPNTDVGQLATALNELGLTARDVIAIFQAIDQAGALQGELVIM